MTIVEFDDLSALIDRALRPSALGADAREYDLHRINDDWIITKHGELDLLVAGRKPRVIAANLTEGHLQAIRRKDLVRIKRFDQCRDGCVLEDGLAKVRQFTAIRNSARAPYLGALSFTAPPAKVKVFRHGEEAGLQALSHVVRIDVHEDADGSRLVSPGLGPADLRLVDIWQSGRVGHRRGDDSDARRERFSLLSLGYARLAEKLVLGFYEAQQVAAIDISLTQLDDRGELWRSCDILVGDHLDVKNATSYGSRRRHVFVNKFKKVQTEDVLIAGVVSSPFSEFKEYPRRRKKYQGGYYVHSVHQTFLGLASVTRLKIVQQTINALPYRTQALRLSFIDSSLPPWAFEVPVDIDRAKLMRVAQLFSYEPTTIVALSLASGSPVPESISAGLNDSQRQVLHAFSSAIAGAGYSKATIALFTISEFIRWVVEHRNAASLVRFIRKLTSVESFRDVRIGFSTQSTRSDKKYEIDIDFDGSCCGGLPDPMSSVADLFTLLEECAEHIQRSGIRLIHLDAPGPHVLVGKEEGGKTVTLYAYCGGKLQNGMWCNHFPLIISRNPTCSSCGRLICEHCEFCSDGCADREARKAASAQQAAVDNETPFG